MKPSNTIVVSPKYIEEKERQIADLSKKVERLQEQLNEANEAIDEAYWDCFREGFEPELATEYRKKYGLNANDDKYK